ncbi:MAG: endonuclease III [Clostridiales bacterium]|nr:endonuclease III [Clostridiales bacterium]
MVSAQVDEVLARLARAYPSTKTALHWETPFQLLVATVLSAQTTDQAVNKVTPALFARFPTPEALAQATPEDVEPYIQTLGLYRNKARHLVGLARKLVANYGGEVPRDREALESLPGVGRKTANVVLANAFGYPAIAVDTHVFRVARRLGWSQGRDPYQVEKDLMNLIPRDLWAPAHHWLIHHGRQVCHARRPRCEACFLKDLCPSASLFLKEVSTGE